MTTVGAAVNYTGNVGGLGRSKPPYSDETFPGLFDDGLSDGRAVHAEDAQESASGQPAQYTFSLLGKIVTATNLATKLKPMDIAELPEADYQTAMDVRLKGITLSEKSLQSQYTDYSAPDFSNEPRVQTYATVTVGGRVVATIDNQGVVESSDADYLRFKAALSESVNTTNGPDLAQRRAEEIAAVMGGTVQKSTTAITQSQFEALPEAATTKTTVDYDAMRRDPAYQMIQDMYAQYENTVQRRAQYLATR